MNCSTLLLVIRIQVQVHVASKGPRRAAQGSGLRPTLHEERGEGGEYLEIGVLRLCACHGAYLSEQPKLAAAVRSVPAN